MNDNQFWSHVPGTEYLAADPFHIPKLRKILQECILNKSAAPHVYVDRLPAADRSRLPKDPFATLAPELRLLILGLLDYKDVATLRLVSRIFRVMPQSFFRSLIRERMPWMWEIDEETNLLNDRLNWFQLWSRLSQVDGGRGRKSKGLSYKLEKPELGNGARINGLVNRRRIWHEAESILEVLSMQSRRSLERP